MFKDKLKKLRTIMGLTQQQLADRLYTSRSLIAKWEQGRSIPQEDMLQMLVDFFEIDRAYFYDKDEPNKLIEKLFKKNRLYLVISSFIFLGLLLFVGIFIYDKVNQHKDEILYDTFYTETYLDKMQVSGLKSIYPNHDGGILYNSLFYMNVESSMDLHNYAAYIYNYLFNSFEVTYIGFGVDIAIESDNITRSPNDLRTFIKISSDLRDYVTYSGDVTYYTFYYLTSIHKNHEVGQQINPYIIRLSYSESNTKWGILDNNEWAFRNFSMSLNETQMEKSQKYLVGHYIFDDYFLMERVNLDAHTITNYFTLDIYEGDDYYMLLIRPNVFIFKYYLDVEIKLEDENQIMPIDQIITRNSNTVKYMKDDLIGMSKHDILNKVKISFNEGYFYQMHEK